MADEPEWAKHLSADVRAALEQGETHQKQMMVVLGTVADEGRQVIERLDGIDRKLDKLDTLDDISDTLRLILGELRKKAG